MFLIKSDTRIEGKLRVKLKVTVGFVTSDDGDVARLIVVRQETAGQESRSSLTALDLLLLGRPAFFHHLPRAAQAPAHPAARRR